MQLYQFFAYFFADDVSTFSESAEQVDEGLMELEKKAAEPVEEFRLELVLVVDFDAETGLLPKGLWLLLQRLHHCPLLLILDAYFSLTQVLQ